MRNLLLNGGEIVSNSCAITPICDTLYHHIHEHHLSFCGNGNGTTLVKFFFPLGIGTYGQTDLIKTNGFIKCSNVFAFHGSTDNYSNVAGQNFHELNSGQGNEFILMQKTLILAQLNMVYILTMLVEILTTIVLLLFKQ